MTAFTNHHLTAEHVNDKSGPAVMLTQQEGIEDAETIIIHPWQLIAACEHLGLTASDPKAAKDIATLQRRMLVLRDRIDNLHGYLVNHSDHRHADLTYEVTYATACIDLADEFCADFEPTMQSQVTPDNANELSASNASSVTSPLPPTQLDLGA